jgi:isopentenyl diphosphate isomerase/L-lactate dehydrogenase-like FMN-dependent dehydrogenase
LVRISRDRYRTFEEFENLAAKRIPSSLFREVSTGKGRGITTRRNIEAFDEITFRVRAGVGWPGKRELATTVLGKEISMPVLIGPVGGLRLMHPDGAAGAARAASAAGTICTISTTAGHSPDEVADASVGPLWQQIYMLHGRDGAERLIDAARRRGFHALVLTVDPTAPQINTVLRISPKNIIQYGPELVRRPRWLAGFIRDGFQLASVNQMLVPTSPLFQVTWEDLAWIRTIWNGPLVVKGILRPEDARRAVDAGAEAIVVSNHGGMVLDGLPPTVCCLPKIIDEIGGEVEVLLDGGVRQGVDIVKALALGARAVLIGRPYVMGLCADGTRGVSAVLESLRTEIDQALVTLGCRSIDDLDPTYVDMPSTWATPDSDPHLPERHATGDFALSHPSE